MARARKLLRRQGIARSGELERVGLSRVQVRRLVSSGELERLGHGLYTLPDAERSEHQALAEATLRVPSGIICLLSALRFHGLTTQNPFEVWMAVPHKAWRPKPGYPPLRLVFLAGRALEEGVERHKVDGVTVPVFSAAKTVADCFKFRNKIGLDVAIEALRDFHRRHPKMLDVVWRFAEADRMTRVLKPYLESLE